MRLTSHGAGHKTKQEFVYQTLRGAIMRCELVPGQRLIIQSIARQLAVSPIPVREALQLLHSEGLVEHSPHSGATVSRISEASVVEAFTVKEGLETVAARAAVGRLTTEDLDALATLVDKMDDALRDGEYERWGDLNAEFHITIAEATAMPLLQETTRRVLDQWQRIQRYFFGDVLLHRLLRSQQDHHAMVRALRERDPEEAERLSRDHNRNALADYVQHMSEQR